MGQSDRFVRFFRSKGGVLWPILEEINLIGPILTVFKKKNSGSEPKSKNSIKRKIFTLVKGVFWSDFFVISNFLGGVWW
jgi:hypothetical protein